MTCLNEIDGATGMCTTYEDSRWPRERTTERILSGFKRLQEDTLPKLVKYLAKVNRECSGDNGVVGNVALRNQTAACVAPQTVKQFLEGSTIQACLKSECKRRGLPVSGLKAALVNRILKHIDDYSITPGFYMNMDHSDTLNFQLKITDFNPQGFLPTDAAPPRAVGDSPLH